MKHSYSHNSTLIGYSIGFFFSLILTILSFCCVMFGNDIFSNRSEIIMVVCILAFAQVCVQARYFLHLNMSHRSRWNTAVFLYTFLLVGIVGIGSLWIMNNLAVNMMSPMETDAYMTHQ